MVAPLALLAAALAFGGLACGSSGDTTELVITGYARGLVLRSTLECDPARGTAPRPRVLCSALERQPKLLLEPQGPDPTTLGGRSIGRCSSTSSVRIEGRYRGKAVSAHFDRCDPGAELGRRWERLLGIPDGVRRDRAREAIWRVSRQGDRRSVESISRFDLSIYKRVRRFHVKYNSGRCEIWIATRAQGGVGAVEKLRDEKPCYASAPWRGGRRAERERR